MQQPSRRAAGRDPRVREPPDERASSIRPRFRQLTGDAHHSFSSLPQIICGSSPSLRGPSEKSRWRQKGLAYSSLLRLAPRPQRSRPGSTVGSASDS